MELQTYLRDHPVLSGLWALLGFLLVALPVYVGRIWPLFSDRPFVEVMRQRNWGRIVTGPIYGWITVIIGTVLVVLTAYAVFAPKPTLIAGWSGVPAAGGHVRGQVALVLPTAVANSGAPTRIAWDVDFRRDGNAPWERLATLPEMPPQPQLGQPVGADLGAPGIRGNNGVIGTVQTADLHVRRTTAHAVATNTAVAGYIVALLPVGLTREALRGGEVRVTYRDEAAEQRELFYNFRDGLVLPAVEHFPRQ